MDAWQSKRMIWQELIEALDAQLDTGAHNPRSTSCRLLGMSTGSLLPPTTTPTTARTTCGGSLGSHAQGIQTLASAQDSLHNISATAQTRDWSPHVSQQTLMKESEGTLGQHRLSPAYCASDLQPALISLEASIECTQRQWQKLIEASLAQDGSGKQDSQVATIAMARATQNEISPQSSHAFNHREDSGSTLSARHQEFQRGVAGSVDGRCKSSDFVQAKQEHTERSGPWDIQLQKQVCEYIAQVSSDSQVFKHQLATRINEGEQKLNNFVLEMRQRMDKNDELWQNCAGALEYAKAMQGEHNQLLMMQMQVQQQLKRIRQVLESAQQVKHIP